jgi:hypothetical protein
MYSSFYALLISSRYTFFQNFRQEGNSMLLAIEIHPK